MFCMENEGVSLMETGRQEEKEQKEEGKEKERERGGGERQRQRKMSHRLQQRFLGTGKRTKAYGFISSRDLQREMGMWFPLLPNTGEKLMAEEMHIWETNEVTVRQCPPSDPQLSRYHVTVWILCIRKVLFPANEVEFGMRIKLILF